jgi:hypothetical protein
MLRKPFERSEHVYRNDAFAELIKDAVRFFNGTPVQDIPLPTRFFGCGVYALYYIGVHPLYERLSAINRLSYDVPIYVGKAVPHGWRRGRVSDSTLNQTSELHSRIMEHTQNVFLGDGLSVNEFACRFVIFEEGGSAMISTVEAALIKLFRPLWNTVVDGFGNHTPGAGRFEQAKSDWDVLHFGRPFADRCSGIPKSVDTIHKNIDRHFSEMKSSNEKR